MANRYFDNSQLAEAVRIANGQTTGVSHINKFGYNDAVGGTQETIWDAGGLYAYASAPTLLTVTSTQDDSGLDIEIQGLDSDYFPLTETITTSSGGTVGTSRFSRIFRALVISEIDSANEDNINITGDGKTLARISAEKGQTLMALYTVPANKTAYLQKFQGSVSAQNAPGIFKIMAKPVDGAFNVKGQFGTAGTPVTYDYPVPLQFGEKTDIEIRATSGNNGAGAVFDLIILDN